jgi:penicillin amidase
MGTIVIVGACCGVLALRASLPVLDGTAELRGLEASVTVASDNQGIPAITAGSRADALRALGYVTAQDRLFQMDFLRRHSAGRLAEVLGESAVEMDRSQRTFGFSSVAAAVLRRLPVEQKEALEAYAEGVNAFLKQMTIPPFEFLLLGYRPKSWQPTDSLLIVLGMFQMLNGYDDDERMRTVMKASLPADVAAFLVPPMDPYTDMLLRRSTASAISSVIPVEGLASLRRPVDPGRPTQASLVTFKQTGLGSNAWAVGGSNTKDGRAILANDMHLDMAVPNIWYRVQFRYGHVEMVGMVVPGIPVMIAGSNGHVAWGMTNVEGDFLDLVQVKLNPGNSEEYAAPDGWRRFANREEAIAVKGGADRHVTIKETVWGPIAEEPLLGRPVAIRWTALDPTAVDLGLLYMDAVRSLHDAVTTVNAAGGPPNNVLLADADGHIAWTYTGRIPNRTGFDGSVSLSWADGRVGWSGFLRPDQMPRIVNPSSGFLVSANHRMLGDEFPYVIGHSFVNGYRAYRITERLRTMEEAGEADLLALQLDTTTTFYEFYRTLARQVLTEEAIRRAPHLAEVRAALDAWNGKADVDSKGFGLVMGFRKTLARSVFTPFLELCREKDRRFVYDGDLDTPLRALLKARLPQLLPDPEHFHDWDAFLLNALEKSAEELKSRYAVTSLENLSWGRMNRVQMVHPFGDVLPGLGLLLNMPEEEAPGCGQCVRVISGSLAASQRMVVSPAHQEAGIFHMPGGQSGHPFSPHYRDQHRDWSEGLPSSLLPGLPTHRLMLTPSPASKPVAGEQVFHRSSTDLNQEVA